MYIILLIICHAAVIAALCAVVIAYKTHKISKIMAYDLAQRLIVLEHALIHLSIAGGCCETQQPKQADEHQE